MATDQEKFDELKREIDMRRKVYPHWIAQGRIKTREAERRIGVMEEIAADYLKRMNQTINGEIG